MEYEDKIIYTYTHSINRKSKVQISKKGIYIRRVEERGNPFPSPNPKCVVKLNGNKGNTVCYESQIELIKNKP